MTDRADSSGDRATAPDGRIANRFRVLDVLAETRTTRTYAAYDEAFEQPVDLAIWTPGERGLDAAAERFLREARAMASVTSTHAPRVFDVGDLPGGATYVAMEHLEGEDLGEVLRAQGPMPIERAVDDVLEAIEGLAFAHAEGILHCEIHPGALLRARDEGGETLVKLVDFRFSTDGRAGGEATLRTMAPEQLASGHAEERTDLYAMGAVLYELLTGSPAFDGPTAARIRACILEGTPRPIREVRPDVPAGLAAVLKRCLARDPSQRHETAGDLAPALAPFGSGRAAQCVARAQIVLGTVPGMRSARPVPLSSAPPPPPEPEGEHRRPSPSWP